MKIEEGRKGVTWYLTFPTQFNFPQLIPTYFQLVPSSSTSLNPHSQPNASSNSDHAPSGRQSCTSSMVTLHGQTVRAVSSDPLSANSVWSLPRPKKYCCTAFVECDIRGDPFFCSAHILLRGYSVEDARSRTWLPPPGTHPANFAPNVRNYQLSSPCWNFVSQSTFKEPPPHIILLIFRLSVKESGFTPPTRIECISAKTRFIFSTHT